jgi:putative hydrolase of the HAD superfamily
LGGVMIKTIIFDLDDTLYNERDFVYGAFSEVCKYLFENYSVDYDNLYKDAIEILNKYGRGQILNILCHKYNINENIEKLVNIYRHATPGLKLYDDALFILEKLKVCSINENGYKYNLGLITDGKASVQWNKIETLKLKNYMGKIIVTDDYGKDFWKPNEFAYREMMNYFNCKSEDCLYIGDNPSKDFIGARKVGIYTVRIIRQIGDYMHIFSEDSFEADCNITSLKEIENIIVDL